MKNRMLSARHRGGSSHRSLSQKGRWLKITLLLLPVMVLIAWGLTLVIPAPLSSQNALTPPVSAEQIQRGAYLARVGDCVACHSQAGKPAFSGGVAIASPIGGMVPPNITPDKQFGIGDYSYADFDNAVRHGIRKDSATLYPAMPWPSYSRISQQDMQALYAYFINGVKAVPQASQQNTIPWPLSLRWPMTWWRWLFAPETGAVLQHTPEDPVQLGAYYVTGLGHCGACHTPRAITLQEVAYDNSQGTSYLSGGQVIDGYAAPSLRAELRSGLGKSRDKDLVELLKTGVTDTTATFGPMSAVVTNSTHYMSVPDLQAIAAYLRTLSPAIQQSEPFYTLETWNAFSRGDVSKPGAEVYLKNCSGCHLTNGLGYRKKFPALALNAAVNSADPAGLISIVLQGASQAETGALTSRYVMPRFDGQLSDRQIADVLSFIRSSWGNESAPVSASAVSTLRKNSPSSGTH
ncbi:c-type cytochrome [Pseudomonas cerasi]